MWLDDLEELVGLLRDRISDHRSVLTRSESTTRYALINPLLAGLGWDLADPHQVLTEYEASYEGDDNRHYADYVLLHGKRPALVIEAKSLGTRLGAGDAIDQGTKYCNRLGIQHFVLTDGSQWEARDKTDPRKPVFKFDVADSRANVIQLLWLWPGNFQGDRPRIAPTPKLHEQPSDVAISASRPSTTPSSKPATSRVPLPNVNYTQGMSKPRRLTFPDGTTKDVSKSWASVHAETAKWLIDNDRVMSLPLCNRYGTHLMYKRPTKKDGTPFKDAREVRKNFWIDMHFGPSDHLRKAAELLLSCDVDPNSVRLELH